MYLTNIYKVTTTHPAGYLNGDHRIEVAVNRDGTRFCRAGKLGCSRDYVANTDKDAITMFLREHMITASKITKIRK